MKTELAVLITKGALQKDIGYIDWRVSILRCYNGYQGDINQLLEQRRELDAKLRLLERGNQNESTTRCIL